MHVITPTMTWAPGMHRPDRVHMQETCDGRPRTLTVDSDPVKVAVCRAWLADTSPFEVRAACEGVATQLGQVV